tara:strand:- start:244 stop:474 length:231 start_codon:yes stop_codon:yes gene_type:complete
MHPVGFENSMMALSDTVFETKKVEEQGKLQKFYRIRNSDVIRYNTEWQQIQDSQENVTPKQNYILKEIKTQPENSK